MPGSLLAAVAACDADATIAEFTDLRWITIETKAPHYPF